MSIPEPSLLLPRDTGYPAEQLRSAFGGLALPELWYLGNRDLLKSRGIGFCGSRHASDTSLTVAADCATQLSACGLSVISGYAPGVDMVSHEAALAHGGNTVIVLPEGINQFRIKRAIKAVWDWERVAVISYFQKDAIWRPDRAMDRNKVIVALSDAVLVLEARDRGGTLNAGYCALQMKKPLFVALFDEIADGREGNQELLKRGGIPLRRSRSSGHAELRHMFEVIQTPDGTPPAKRLSA
jgi:DNA processing protein